MVLGQGDDKEGANILNVRIWVEGAVLEYETRCVKTKCGNFGLRVSTLGGRPDANTKENPVLETI